MNPDSLAFRLLELYAAKLQHRGQWRIIFALADYLNANVDREFAVVRQGVHWYLNPSDSTQRDVFWLSEKDSWEVYHIKKLLASVSAPVIFDVGANFGYYAIVLAKHFRQRCKVFAFEPFASTFSLLARHIEVNGLRDCITAVPLALGDSESSAAMQTVSGSSGETFVRRGEPGDVRMTTVDLFCSRNEVDRVDFFKIDVEGFEPFLLSGGERTLRSSSAILMIEINSKHLERVGSSPGELLRRLSADGYSVYLPRRHRLHPVGSFPGEIEHVNAFCIPAARR